MSGLCISCVCMGLVQAFKHSSSPQNVWLCVQMLKSASTFLICLIFFLLRWISCLNMYVCYNTRVIHTTLKKTGSIHIFTKWFSCIALRYCLPFQHNPTNEIQQKIYTKQQHLTQEMRWNNFLFYLTWL